MKELIFPYSKKKVTLDVADNVPILNITENGEYSVKGYDKAVVNVEGGSSDFSTAEVIVTNSTESNVNQNGIAIFEYMGEEAMASEFPPIFPNTSVTYDFVLFKGQQTIYAPDDVHIAVTGDITEEEGEIVITGDGTITYTAK